MAKLLAQCARRQDRIVVMAESQSRRVKIEDVVLITVFQKPYGVSSQVQSILSGIEIK
jgi:hypothetical protein